MQDRIIISISKKVEGCDVYTRARDLTNQMCIAIYGKSLNECSEQRQTIIRDIKSKSLEIYVPADILKHREFAEGFYEKEFEKACENYSGRKDYYGRWMKGLAPKTAITQLRSVINHCRREHLQMSIL